MMKKIVAISVTVILTIILGSAIYLLIQSEQKKELYKQIASQANNLYTTLKQEQKILFKNEGCTIDTITIKDIKGKKITVDSLITKSPCMVLYISSLHCGDCVDYTLSLIKSNIINKNVNILIFASGYQSRDLYVFARSNGFDETCFYNVNSLNIPLEELNMPFIFILDNRQILDHFFIPRKEEYQESEKRLSMLVAELLKNGTQNVLSQDSNKK